MSYFTGTSLTEARQLYEYTVTIDAKLVDIERKAKTATVSYADLYNVMQDVFFLIRRMGLPEDVERGIITLYRLIAAVNALRVASLALIAATAPLGFVGGALGVGAAGLALIGIIGSVG